MGTRVEQSGEFPPRAGGAGRCHLEDMADSLHRLSPAVEDLQIIIPRGNRTSLLQREFRITLTHSCSFQLGHGLVAVAMTRRTRSKVFRARTPSSWNERSAGSSPGSS